MFVTRKEVELIMKLHTNEIKFLNDRYWELCYRHNTLLSHLGLEEVKIPGKTELRPKSPIDMSA